ncbi:MAG: peptide chain release factor N(5)-glutamine methyltransferase [Methylotenera sp.]|nr:peptide chain release factor N(5)-glutamine methyltransferase [Methylotenera sp.]HOY86347.1 peptide chain release factor N(5)-glutamine methyltransferase [Methylotenera sp.]HPM49815.1 peptide chain release factor N(5)-glutamine methyltransferase [Methylotenera sp.]HPV32138.1 peptide chain release factor N(5)-glutamine methyltransferase [Methylotenera sp.]
MPNTQSIKSALAFATVKLNHDEAKLEAQLLLQHVLNVNRAWLIAHENDALQANQHAAFEALLNRRLNGEPIAYILGGRAFYGLDLLVTPDTLIPRPDTETLVEAALAQIPIAAHPSILDLGTGSGAIALAIAKNRPQASVIAVDASKAALAVAKKNAQNLSIDNVEFVLSNWFQHLNNQPFDVIVSNPPYIEENDAHLSQGDLRFEPISALSSGEDGLNDIRQIIENSLVHLQPQGWLMLEHGFNQADKVADLMANTGFVSIETIKDFGGNNRVTIGKNPLIVSTHWAE